MTELDTEALAERAGLVCVELDVGGILRRGRGRGFTYEHATGRAVGRRTRSRIEALVIPPAWRDVWIAPSADAHVLACGTDDAGRRQYLYHPEFRRVADEHKFARVRELGERLARIRRHTDDALRSGDERDLLIGGVIRLIDRLLLRVGTERYVEEHETFGACTLRWQHVRLDGDRIHLAFRTKGGTDRAVDLDDPQLAEVLRARRGRRSADGRVFAAADGWEPDGDAIAAALTDMSGIAVTAKDLRTWGATATMVDELMEPDVALESTSDDEVLAALDAVADRLGNTRAVARGSYVAPRVVEAHERGELAASWFRSRRSRWYSRAEQTVLKVMPRPPG